MNELFTITEIERKIALALSLDLITIEQEDLITSKQVNK